MDTSEHSHDPLRPHRHDPNPATPTGDGSFVVHTPQGMRTFSLADLQQYPAVTLTNCYIVSTGHGTSGPFRFTGVPLLSLIAQMMGQADWRTVAVVSADGFGARLYRHEVEALPSTRPALLAYAIDDQPLTRRQGLVRLIEPNETDDALRQVKWIARIEIV